MGDFFYISAQGNNGWRSSPALAPEGKGDLLFIDNGFDCGDGRTLQSQIGVTRGLQIVDIVADNTGQLVAVRVNVTGKGDIDQYKWAFLTDGTCRAHILPANDWLRCAGRGDDHIGPGQGSIHFVPVKNPAIAKIHQHLGSVIRAVQTADFAELPLL